MANKTVGLWGADGIA